MPDLKKTDCLVIIPAYNEEKNIARLVSSARSLGFPVLVVDDGSSDLTAAAAKGSGAEVLLTATNQGKGSALRRGFSWFLDKNYTAAIVMDSDGQHDPKELESFLKALNQDGCQVVVGNRFDDPKGMPRLRRVTNRFMSWIISTVTKQNIPDSQCGYRAIRRGVLQKISLKTSYFEIESEILLEAARHGFKIISIPTRCVYQGEKSRINPVRDTARFFRFLFKYLANSR